MTNILSPNKKKKTHKCQANLHFLTKILYLLKKDKYICDPLERMKTNLCKVKLKRVFL